MTRGYFITLDGTEGAGKSTQTEYIHHWCISNGIEVLLTREPGGTHLGEQLRSLLLDSHTEIDALGELLLLLTARRAHIKQVILPALAQGKWVISDRFSDATYAYQHYGRGIAMTTIHHLEQITETVLLPDLGLILGVDARTAQARIDARCQDKDRFEQEDAAFFARVAAGYRQCADLPGRQWIDCNAAPETVFNRIRPHLEALLPS